MEVIYVFCNQNDTMSASFISLLKNASGLFSSRREDRKKVLRSEEGLRVETQTGTINIIPVLLEKDPSSSDLDGWTVTSKMVRKRKGSWYFQIRLEERYLILNSEYQHQSPKVLPSAVKQLIAEICKTAL